MSALEAEGGRWLCVWVLGTPAQTRQSKLRNRRFPLASHTAFRRYTRRACCSVCSSEFWSWLLLPESARQTGYASELHAPVFDFLIQCLDVFSVCAVEMYRTYIHATDEIFLRVFTSFYLTLHVCLTPAIMPATTKQASTARASHERAVMARFCLLLARSEIL